RADLLQRFTQLRHRGADRRDGGAVVRVGVQATLGVAETCARQRRLTMILLPYLVKATLIISAAAAVLAFDRRASAAFRHLICAVAFGGLLALPILSSAMPAWELSGPANQNRQGSGGQEALSRRPSMMLRTADGHYGLIGPAEAGHYVPSESV